MRLRVGHQHSQVWPILTRFVNYYSPFWDRKAISIVIEPQGALTCQSSTLAVLADSGPFHGLLLTVLESRSDVHDERTLGAFTCRSSTHTVLADSGPFCGLLLTVLGPRSDFHSR